MSPTATAPARTRGGAAAPARPRHQPAPAPVRRHLRPVPDAPSRAARPRRRVRPQAALMIALLAFFLILFGVALLQTVLVQGQLHLDGLRADLSERQVQAQIDRDEVARAESPEALISAAEAQGFTPSDPIFTPAIPEAGAAAP